MIKVHKGKVKITGDTQCVISEFFALVSSLEDEFKNLKSILNYSNDDNNDVADLIKSMLDCSIQLSKKSKELEQKLNEL